MSLVQPYTDAVTSLYQTLVDHHPHHPLWTWRFDEGVAFVMFTLAFYDFGLVTAMAMSVFGIIGARFIIAALLAIYLDEPLEA